MHRFNLVATGGTFDRLHKGHAALLHTAFAVGKRVVIGLTLPAMTRGKKFRETIQSFAERMKQLRAFLKKNGFLKRAKIIRLKNVYGPTLRDGFQAIVCTSETLAGARKVNRRRRELGLKPLRVIVCPLVLSEDKRHISSARMRGGEEDREGFLYKKLFEKNLLATPAARRTAKKPLDVLYASPQEARRVVRAFRPMRLILVGDAVARSLAVLRPHIVIADGKIERRCVALPRAGKKIVCVNPRGGISRGLAKAVRKAVTESLKTRAILVRVRGEEDYAALPAILFAPLRSVVAYGQPRRGIVVVKVDEAAKEKASALVKKFAVI